MMRSNRLERDPYPPPSTGSVGQSVLRGGGERAGDGICPPLRVAKATGEGPDPTGGVTGSFQWAVLCVGRSGTCVFLIILNG